MKVTKLINHIQEKELKEKGVKDIKYIKSDTYGLISVVMNNEEELKLIELDGIETSKDFREVKKLLKKVKKTYLK